MAARHVGDRAAVRPLRVPADHDARLRGHCALRADLRCRLRRRPEGDVHVLGSLGPVAHAAAGSHRADLPRLRRARHAARATAGEALHDRVDVPLRRARQGPPPRALAGVRRGDRQRRSGDRRGADPALRRVARAARRHALPPRAQLDRLPRVPARRTSTRFGPGSTRTSIVSTRRRARRRRRARSASSTTTRRSRTPCAPRSTRHRRSASRCAPSASSASASSALTSTQTGVEYQLVPTLVRGLDYYSRTTWEFIGPLENENATLSGGGRYDYLVEEIGGPPTPGVGFGAGIERLLLAMEEEGVAERRAADDRRLLRRRARRAAGDRRSLAGRLRARGRLLRHRLRGPLAQGPADAGRSPRRVDDGRGRRPTARPFAAPEAPTRRSPTTSFSTDCRDELA